MEEHLDQISNFDVGAKEILIATHSPFLLKKLMTSIDQITYFVNEEEIKVGNFASLDTRLKKVI